MHNSSRGSDGDGRQEGGQENEKEANPVDSQLIADTETRNPRHLLDELHLTNTHLKIGKQFEGEEKRENRDTQRRPSDQVLPFTGKDQEACRPNCREKGDQTQKRHLYLTKIR